MVQKVTTMMSYGFSLLRSSPLQNNFLFKYPQKLSLLPPLSFFLHFYIQIRNDHSRQSFHSTKGKKKKSRKQSKRIEHEELVLNR